MKVIVHIDMDMFYAAVEMRDQPHLKEKPMAVGTKAKLSSTNHKARTFGIRDGMAVWEARKLCPVLIIIEPNNKKYFEEADKVKNVLARFGKVRQGQGKHMACIDISSMVEARIKVRPIHDSYMF